MADSCQPDGWFKIGNPTLVAVKAYEVGLGPSEDKLLYAILGPNEGFGQYLGVVTSSGSRGLANEAAIMNLVAGNQCYASIYLAVDSTSPGTQITLSLEDHDGTSWETNETLIIPETTALQRYAHYRNFRPTAISGAFKVFNSTASYVYLYANNAMFHPGSLPLAYRPSSGWEEKDFVFASPGDTTADLDLYAAGVPAGRHPCLQGASSWLILKGAAEALTAPSGTGEKFTALIDGDGTAAHGLTIEMGDGTSYGEAHITDYTIVAPRQSDRFVAAKVTGVADVTAGQNTVVTFTGYRYRS